MNARYLGTGQGFRRMSWMIFLNSIGRVVRNLNSQMAAPGLALCSEDSASRLNDRICWRYLLPLLGFLEMRSDRQESKRRNHENREVDYQRNGRLGALLQLSPRRRLAAVARAEPGQQGDGIH